MLRATYFRQCLAAVLLDEHRVIVCIAAHRLKAHFK